MKNVAMFCVAALALAVATTASAGERQAAAQDSVSANTLASMGLGGMKLLSDEQGMQIRASGKAKVWAYNYALVKVFNTGNLDVRVDQKIIVKVKGGKGH
jgi:hypothetical protein